MSDNRKVLSAKRKNERGKAPTHIQKAKQVPQDFKRGIKRPITSNDTPKKNLANERMKRLRTALNEELEKTSSPQSKPGASSSVVNKKLNKQGYNTRKRPQNAPGAQTTSSVKLSRREEEPTSFVSNEPDFVFKEEFITQRKASTTNLPNPFAASNFIGAQQSSDNTEDMEWSTADNDIITSLSASTSTSSHSQTVNNTNCNKSSSKNNFVIVVDTNVFLSHLQLIKDIITMDITGDIQPIIFIPWIVIEELDFIKEDKNRASLKFKAQEAVKYIEKNLSIKHERIMGQTLNDVNEQKSTGNNQDDKIIACSLQVSEKYNNMILLTGDINLKNKAHFNNIPVCSHTEIKPKICLVLKKKKSQVILEKMTSLCSTVIYECARNAYGEACNKMPICRSPPKSLQECILIFTKYWFPVFQEVLMKQFRKSIDDLSTFLTNNKIINDGTSEMQDLLRLCVRVCLFLKDVECCRNTIEGTIRDLNIIKES